MLSSVCYHLELMLSSGTKCYHLGWNFIIWDKMFSSWASSGMKCYHLELMLSYGTKCYHLELMLSSVLKCYHLGLNVIIWMKCYHLELMLSSSGANVIIWSKYYHLVLSCDVIIWNDNTPLLYFSWKLHSLNCRHTLLSGMKTYFFWIYFPFTPCQSL